MAFKAPGKPLKRGQPLVARKPIALKPVTPETQREQAKQALQKRTLHALEKARRLAAEQGVDLSDWEDEFLNSVAERVKTYGRAFHDPDKGAMNGTLSLRQGVKLREIRKKAQKSKDTPPEAETPYED